jgi:precorrin-6B C5,15-methyltransferase / cobalt-precorrin-6B C5,C15-methyltransferase
VNVINNAITSSLIHVVGLGVSEHAELLPDARDAVHNADIIVGSKRQLETISPIITHHKDRIRLIVFTSLNELNVLLSDRADQSIVVLASGDPLFYGIGAWLIKTFSFSQLKFYPSISSVQAGCHALGFSLQDINVVSLHGRPVTNLVRELKNNKTVALLTDKHSHPQQLALICQRYQFEDSQFWVCEKMGYSDERIRHFSLNELLTLSSEDFDPLHVTFIKVMGKGGILPEFPGIEDQHYETGKAPGKGMITKREVRLLVLSSLQLSQGDIVWDVGAGCGGVSIELAYWQSHASVYAIEKHRERLNYLQINRTKFGVSGNLNIVSGCILDVSPELPQPNKIFIGGSGGRLEEVLKTCWHRLDDHGVLVVSCVTENSYTTVLEVMNQLDVKIDYTTIRVTRGLCYHRNLDLDEKLPVTVFKLKKEKH